MISARPARSGSLLADIHRLLDHTATTAERLEKRASALQSLFNAGAPAAAAMGAIATGLRNWF
jgi:hypothetical protein